MEREIQRQLQIEMERQMDMDMVVIMNAEELKDIPDAFAEEYLYYVLEIDSLYPVENILYCYETLGDITPEKSHSAMVTNIQPRVKRNARKANRRR